MGNAAGMRVLPLGLLLFFSTSCFAYVTISTTSLPAGTVGVSYAVRVYASGGCTPYKWWVSSGSLPAGLSGVTSSTTKSFLIHGTPTTAATYSFSITVRGCGGHISTKSYSVIIKLAPIQHVVALSWAPSTSTNITGYNVYRATVSGGPYSRINSGGLVAATLYDDATVKSGTNYYYVVTTVDSSGVESRFCNQVKAAVPYP
jgi:hypothetical protein